MSAPEVNIPLLRKAVEWAEAEAAKPVGAGNWNQMFVQTETDCGTSYCIAGFVASLESLTDNVYDAHSDPVEYAAEALGIPHDCDEWSPLFDANNSIADVRRIAEDIAGERL